MKHPFLALVAGPVAAAVLAATACSDPPDPVTCHDLAPPACPADGDADVCSDVTECASVYACDNGAWTFLRSCPGYLPEAGAHPVEVEAGVEGGVASDATLDAPAGAYGGPGCVDLQEPDCPLGTALACSGAADCCGCEDLYVCVDGGWQPWGECAEDGGISSRP